MASATSLVMRSCWQGAAHWHPLRPSPLESVQSQTVSKIGSHSFVRLPFRGDNVRVARRRVTATGPASEESQNHTAQLDSVKPGAEVLSSAASRALSEDTAAVSGPVKQCRECQRWKLLVDFRETKATADGRHEWCRACLSAREARRANKELYHLGLSVEDAWERSRTCPGCGEIKELRDFSTDKARVDGLRTYCRACDHFYGKKLPTRGVTVTHQQCKHCGEVKAAGNFFIRRTSPTGLQKVCKSCSALLNLEWKRRVASAPKLPRTEKRCSSCGVVKQAAEFSMESTQSDGLHVACKICVAAYFQARRQRAK